MKTTSSQLAAINTSLRAQGISLTATLALATIAQSATGTLRTGELPDILNISHASNTGLTKALESSGLITRTHNGREIHLTNTDKGTALLKSTMSLIEKNQAAVTTAATAEKKQRPTIPLRPIHETLGTTELSS